MPDSRVQAPMLVIENDTDAPGLRLTQWLGEAGAVLDYRRAELGEELPADLSGYSGLVVLGGDMSAEDDQRAPWLPAVRALLNEAVRAELPAFGVCLGAQLLAVATGGQVRRAELGEYGAYLVAKRQAAAEDPLLRELPITPDVLQWHADEITRLPPGSQLLASSPGCEVQAFRVGRLAWGIQFHIETTPELVAGWAEHDRQLLADYDLDTIVTRAAAAHEDIAEVWRPIAARFVQIAADPRAAAGPRSLPMVGGGGRPGVGGAAGVGTAEVSTAGPITDPAAIRAALAAELQASREPHRH
jgi:GMP synthase-like glutamine amidotransferase